MMWYENPTVKEVLSYQPEVDPEPVILQKVDMDTKVDCNCGMEVVWFDESDIECLLQGKALYMDCNGGEYAHVFAMKGKVKK